ncbi:MAG: hypothetical protein Phyf2KO_11150 [Phycisphaerales bacterium]
MSSAHINRINPKFIELAKARLDAVEATLDTIERGWRYPDLWKVNGDLDTLAGWTRDIPELRTRVEQLGERYAKIAFAPAPGLPSKYLPKPAISPSLRSDHIATPIGREEAARMIAALNADGFLIECPWPGSVDATTHIHIPAMKRYFHPARLRRGLAIGPVRGRAAARLEILIQTLLIAMSGTSVMTTSIRQTSRCLEDVFPHDASWYEKRFGVLRRRLIEEGYLRRAGRSRWVRVDQRNNQRAEAAFKLLDRIDQYGSETPTEADSVEKPIGGSDA